MKGVVSSLPRKVAVEWPNTGFGSLARRLRYCVVGQAPLGRESTRVRAVYRYSYANIQGIIANNSIPCRCWCARVNNFHNPRMGNQASQANDGEVGRPMISSGRPPGDLAHH